jgi:Cu/Ag efflux pump CusA
VRVNGQRSVFLTIQKAGNALTLNVISGIKALLPQIKTTVPAQLEIAPLPDQSIFVRGAISGVVRETAIAACLTAFMILTFLGSWRTAVIIATSILSESSQHVLSVGSDLIVISGTGLVGDRAACDGVEITKRSTSPPRLPPYIGVAVVYDSTRPDET